MIKISTQQELDKALAAGETEFEFIAQLRFELRTPLNKWIKVSACVGAVVEAWGSSRVEAWESSRVVARESSRVVARGSSRVEAWESSRVVARESSRVVARGSSSVEAWGSSSVEAWESSRVVARGSSSVEAWGSSSVVAWGSSSVVARESSSVEAWERSRVVACGYVSITAFGGTIKMSAKCHTFVRSLKAKITGGQTTDAITRTPQDWCDEYGVETKNGLALVYKALNDDFSSQRDSNFKYTHGTKPAAPCFDNKECSHGLHASPSPKMAKYHFHSSATKFVGCWVKIEDMLIFPDGQFPHKCKFPSVAKPVFEVDIDGNPVKVEKKIKKDKK
jgi:hypothetical protein